MRKVVRIRYIIIIAIFVALTLTGVSLAFAMGDAYALSALSNGSGTEQDPYIIRNVNQLSNLMEIATSDYAEQYTKDKYFRLESDFTVNNIPFLSKNGFHGHLDGDGHTITLPQNGRLFRYLMSGSSVSNLTIETDLYMFDSAYRYGLVHTIEQGAVVDNVTVKANLRINLEEWTKQKRSGYRIYAGGFAAINNGVIKNSHYIGNITSETMDYISVTSSTHFRISCFAPQGKGTIADCVADTNVDVAVCSDVYSFTAFSYENFVDYCTLNGNVKVSMPDKPNMSALGMRTDIYVLAMRATECTFVGDFTFDYRQQYRMNTAVHNIALSQSDSCKQIGKFEIINKHPSNQ